MSMEVFGPDDAVSAARLAKALGVSVSIVRRWPDYDVPLRAEPTNSGAQRYTLNAAAAFISANDGLPSAPTVRRALAELGVIGTGTASAPQTPRGRAAQPVFTEPTRREVSIEDLAAIARDVRASLDAAVRAVSRQSRLAEDTAKANREIVDELLTSIRGLDASLSTITGPASLGSAGL